MKNNFSQMPTLLKALFLLGVLAPFFSIVSVFTGSIDAVYAKNLEPGASNRFEVIGVILCSIPLLFASYLIIIKYKSSRSIYMIGWLGICLSPLFLTSVRNNIGMFLVELCFYLVIGAFLWFYLFKNRKADFYFRSSI